MTAERPRDDGFALPMVLVFVLVVGALVAVLLGQASTNFISVVTTRTIQDRVAVANAAIDVGIQQLRASTVQGGAIVCAGPTGGAVPLGSVLLDGRSATVSCDVRSGQLPGVEGWAVFITDAAGSITTEAGAGTTVVDGPVYQRGGPAGWSIGAGAALRVVDGAVVQVEPSGCTAAPASLSVGPAPVFRFGCLATPGSLPSASQPLPAPALTSGPPQLPAGDGGAACRTFSPGRYLSAPQLGAAANALRSGVYFLDNVGTWTIDADLVGGIPGPGGSAVSGLVSCANPPETPVGTGGHDGVMIVLGGNSRIVVGDHGRAELFGYLDPARPATPGTSVVQVAAGAPGAWSAKASTVQGSDQVILQAALGATSTLAIRGNVVTPGARIRLTGVSGQVTALSGGVMAAGLDLPTAGSSGSSTVVVSTGQVPAQRDVVLVATADQQGSEKAITATARVTIGNDTDRAVLVQSWIVSNP